MVRLARLAVVLMLSSCTPMGVVPRDSSPAAARRPGATAVAAPSRGAATASSPAAAGPVRPAAEDVAYYRQVSQLLVDKNLEAVKAVDFRRFRRGSMLLRHGGEPAAQAELRPAMKADDLTAVRKAASAMVAEDAAHIHAHIILMNLDQDAGRKPEADLHAAFISGMLHSILGSGDGRAYDTAFVVYFIREEYELVRAMGGQVEGQSLDRQGRKSFDILHVKTKSGVARDVYFDITEPFAEEAKLFGLRE